MKENQQQQSADLKTMGLKVTVPRLKILDLFQKLSESHEAGKRHLSAVQASSRGKQRHWPGDGLSCAHSV